MSNYRTQIEERLNAINSSLGGRNAIELELLGTIDKKVNLPLDVHGKESYGANGQILRSNGSGSTQWVDEGTPTDAQVETAVSDWLDEHPEKTTTVVPGSIDGTKLYPVGTGTDLQNQRTDDSQSANAPYSFIAGGAYNAINDWPELGSHARYSHAEGWSNRAFNWEDHVEGSGSIADGKISHAEGNGVICSSNDAHAEGNRTVAGRKYFANVTVGAEDAGDTLGVLNYVLIPDSEGDVTSLFPNALIDNVTTRYGAGTQKDSVGNIYASGMTPAVWDGDTLVRENSLQWAMHRICILRGSDENDIDYVTIAKCTYTSGVGTKVYYFGNNPTTNTVGIYSSYCPIFLGGGNGAHSEGVFTSAWGYGAHAEGYGTCPATNGVRAWGNGAHAEGRDTQALETATHAEGIETIANGLYSHAEGEGCIASGRGSHAEGRRTKATGAFSHCEGNANIASGESSHAEGETNESSGKYSHTQGRENLASGDWSSAEGWFAVANRQLQKSYSAGKISVAGDAQSCELVTLASVENVGWYNVNLIANVENGKAYDVDIDVIGRQISGSAGTVGDTFAYNIKGLIVVASDGTATVLGTPTKTLIGRSSGMSGDGLSSGVRVALYSGVYPAGKAIALRYDGVANTKFQLFVRTKWLEMKI